MKGLRMIELNNNNFIGSIPESWQQLYNLEYFSIAFNKFGGEGVSMPILWGSKYLVGADMSTNIFEGNYPIEYFS